MKLQYMYIYMFSICLVLSKQFLEMRVELKLMRLEILDFIFYRKQKQIIQFDN